MKILISGICGKMGKEVESLILAGTGDYSLKAGVDLRNDGSASVPTADSFDKADSSVDCIIDFSHRSVTEPLLAFAVGNNIPLVLATTGQTESERAMITEAAKKIPIFFSANYSIGAVLLGELARKTVRLFPDAEIEIIEKHHDRKVDAPSGTALAIANAIVEERPDSPIKCGRNGAGKRDPKEIGIHAIRMGNIVGEHEVLISTGNQTITLKHEAYSRSLFAEGSLRAASFLQGKQPGLYGMKDLITL